MTTLNKYIRKPKYRPVITIEPSVKFGYPCIKPRIDVDMIAGMWWDGSTLEDILRCYEHVNLTKPDVLLCCWYMARYGTRTWRKRWGYKSESQWLNNVEVELWYCRYNCKLPPQVDKPKR
jgi:uncharacterized protein (DUF433 family)